MMPFVRKRAARKAPEMVAGVRAYAIGDVHGRFDLLRDLLARIGSDHAARAPATLRLIFLGDLIDRGPDSRQVVERVRVLCADGVARLVKGNHEEVFVRAAGGDPAHVRALIRMEGASTLASYGFSDDQIHGGALEKLAGTIRTRIPASHVAFLEAADDLILLGDYLFVHAGIRPGVALARQTPDDLRWIREPFLSSTRDHGHLVVHGHTPAVEVDIRANRIGIDTGAFRTGILTAIGLEGRERWFVATGAPDEG